MTRRRIASYLLWAALLVLIPSTSEFGPLWLDTYRQAFGAGGLAWVVGSSLLLSLAAASLIYARGSPWDVAINTLSGGAGILLGCSLSRSPSRARSSPGDG